MVDNANDTRRETPVPVLHLLRQSLLRHISGDKDRLANECEVSNWMLCSYRSNPHLADIERAILGIGQDLVLLESQLPELAPPISSLSKRLERSPLPKRCFVSVTKASGHTWGVLIERDRLEVGGFVYEVTMFPSAEWAQDVIRLEIRACTVEPEPFLSALTRRGWKQYSSQDIRQDENFAFALKCLAAYHDYKHPMPLANQVSVDAALVPPGNDLLQDLVNRAFQNRLICTRATVQLDVVEPDCMEFALGFPQQVIEHYVSQIIDEGRPERELLLYESQGKLMMGDDYPSYLAYKALGLDRVPAVILGAFSIESVQIIEEGYSELIPPVGFSSSSITRPPKPTSGELLRRKLLSLALRPPNSADRLERLYVELCRLLADPRTVEADLHRLIAEHPEILDSYAASVYSEVAIGRFKADLVLRYDQLDRRVVLVELERHSHMIFTKANRLRERVTHASQQVEDWIGELRGSSLKLPSWLNKSYTPEGAVVIGRSTDLSPEQKTILFNINSNRVVKVITYDDLLEKLARLIGTLRSAQ